MKIVTSNSTKSKSQKKYKATGRLMRLRKKRLSSRMTPSETYANELLKRCGIPVKKQVIVGRRYIADFIGSNRLFVLEIDGGYHQNQTKYDRLRDELFEKAGFTVIRIKNEELNEEMIRQLKTFPIVKHLEVNNRIWYAQILTQYPRAKWHDNTVVQTRS